VTRDATDDERHLLIVRHAIAQERGQGVADEERRLTRDGIRRAERAFLGLARLIGPADLVLTSPLPRAHETARLLALALRCRRVEIEPSLRPGGSWRALQKRLGEGGLIAIVGHEPDLGRTACRLLSGAEGDWFPLKKAGAALLGLDGPVRAGRARLAWSLGPSQLNKL
jgi:phosphohistidine phosphatase